PTATAGNGGGSGGSAAGFSVRAVYDYKAVDAGELSFRAGDFLRVTDATSDPDWWTGTFRGRQGVIPASYVTKV
ncbi:GRB2- adapter protein 2, partial [Cladochytrium tenue]